MSGTHEALIQASRLLMVSGQCMHYGMRRVHVFGAAAYLEECILERGEGDGRNMISAGSCWIAAGEIHLAEEVLEKWLHHFDREDAAVLRRLIDAARRKT